jgi:ABC-2 type transport system permease protein
MFEVQPLVQQTGAIFRRELKSYISTPIALICTIVFLVLTGFFTFKLGKFFETGQADLRAFFLWHPWLYLFIVPALSMRLWAEEKRTGTIELLLTLPVTRTEAMIGKFLAAWVVIGAALLLTFPIILTVSYLGQPDMGVIVASYLGSFLMAGAYLAIGCAVSAATSNQIISFVMTTFLCLFFILLGFEPVVDMLADVLPGVFVDQITNMSFPYHFDAIQRGVIDLRDIIYFTVCIAVSLFSGIIVLERNQNV